jgi:UDP-N-acetyl-D-glucosamine dehydrogenase
MWEVIDAASTKPFGFMPFYPGPGLGGHCIPIDPHFLSWMARQHDFETSFITLAARVNEGMPYYTVEAVVEAIAQQPVRLSEAEVLVLGVAYKGNVNDTRHSPAERVIRLLKTKNVENVRYHDPHVPSYSVEVQDGETVDLPSVDLTPETLRSCDVAVAITDHDDYDTEKIARHAPYVVDTRNVLGDVEDLDLREKITLLGGGKQTNGKRGF